MLDGVTFTSLLTAAGAGVAATVVTLFVDLVRTAVPPAATWNGALMAFVVSAALYAATGVATAPAALDGWLAVFLAWLTCATAAVGIHKTIKRTAAARLR